MSGTRVIPIGSRDLSLRDVVDVAWGFATVHLLEEEQSAAVLLVCVRAMVRGLSGVREVYVDGEIRPASILSDLRVPELSLEPKESLAIMNGGRIQDVYSIRDLVKTGVANLGDLANRQLAMPASVFSRSTEGHNQDKDIATVLAAYRANNLPLGEDSAL